MGKEKKLLNLPAPEMDEINEEQEGKIKTFIETVWLPMKKVREDYIAAKAADPAAVPPEGGKMLMLQHMTADDEDRRIACYKFLVARQWDLGKAEDMYRLTAKFKQERNLEEINSFPPAFQLRGYNIEALAAFHGEQLREKNEEVDLIFNHMLPFYQATYHKWDKWGHPVLIEATGNINVKGLVEKLKQLCAVGETPDIPNNKYHVHFNEVGGKILRYQDATWGKANNRRVLGVVVILDCNKLTMGHIYGPALDILKLAWAIDSAHYPEGMHGLYAANCPGMIMFAFNIVKGWLDARVRGKVKFLKPDETQDTLLQVIDAENLPVHLGGTCECEGGCIYGMDGGVPPPPEDPSLLSEIVTVGSGKKTIKEVDGEVDEAIVWQFLVSDDRNIEFSAIFIPEGETAENGRELYLPTKTKTMDTRHVCTEKGKVVLSFSNEYSWVRGKTVTLRLFKIK